MNIEIVIAVFKENIDWVKLYNLEDKSIIYNKLKGRTFENKYKKIINLENIGREGHTYLYHIINNYDNLSDITIFTQGIPFDHSNDFIKKINEISNIDFNNKFMNLGHRLINITNYVCKHHQGIPIKEICDNLFINCPNNFVFAPGAIFAVHKEKILSRPKKFYEKCIKDLENEICPINGYVYERIWSLIFDDKILIKN